MAQTKTETLSSSYTKWGDYVMLVKLKLSSLVVLTSILGYGLAAGSGFSFTEMAVLFVGGFLVTGSANALNQVLEKDYDRHMTRTADRPVTTGRMSSSEAVLFAGITCAIGIAILSLFNPLTSFLGMISFVLYTFVYTPLKRQSTIAVAVGAIPGALPVLIGCTAAEGSITLFGISLFLIQFLWQFPHFWSIGYLAYEDYKKAGFKLVPSSEGKVDRNLGRSSALYTILTVPVIIGMFYMGEISVIAMMATIVMSLGYTFFSLQFQKSFDRSSAVKLMFSSFFYLPLVLITYLIF